MPSETDLHDPQQPRYPIREVSRRTGIPTVTLRAWERRYGLVVPSRTPKGHRLYSDAQIAELRRVSDWVARGVPIGRVREALAGELAADALPATDHQASHDQLLDALTRFDAGMLERQINTLRRELPGEQLAKLLRPLLAELYQHQFDSPLQQATYRFSLSALRDALAQQLRLQHKSSNAPRIGWLVRGDEQHELRALVDTLAVPACRPQWLGRNLPLEVLPHLFERQPLAGLLVVSSTALSIGDTAGLEQLSQQFRLPVYLCSPVPPPTDSPLVALDGASQLNSQLKTD